MNGENYPSGDHDLLFARLGLSADAKILDVGGGARPFSYAQVVVDRDFSAGNEHRDGAGTVLDKTKYFYVQADIESLPFDDHAFDFVICSHVLEHVEFPERACEEIMRVAKGGFIEVPRKWTEYYAGHPTHRWLISEDKGSLIFEPITANNSPFMNFALPPLWDSAELQQQLLIEHANIPCIQLVWQKRFSYNVVSPLPAHVTTDNFQAESHYCFARNVLFWLGKFDAGGFHAQIAAQLVPESGKYHRLHEFYQALNGNMLRAVSCRQLSWRWLVTAFVCRFIRKLYLSMISLHRRLFVKLDI